ncbi:MAG: hypothetical protein OIF34_05245, partial [Porticoccaceae bacterium]|nr:hypothetical protein [Porticoccaceae bacterium]
MLSRIRKYWQSRHTARDVTRLYSGDAPRDELHAIAQRHSDSQLRDDFVALNRALADMEPLSSDAEILSVVTEQPLVQRPPSRIRSRYVVGFACTALASLMVFFAPLPGWLTGP